MPVELFNVAALLVTLSALFSYFNHRYLRLPTAIGLMVIALAFSLGLILAGYLGFEIGERAASILSYIDFNKALLGGMLSFLLFAGALHVELEQLAANKGTIGLLATVGVVLSTLIVGTSIWFCLDWLGMQVGFIYCLLFGALISPTDPIAVLSILKASGAPRSLQAKISGESLFNDGVGVVVFLVLLEAATGHDPSLPHIVMLLVAEVGGGLVLGLLLGFTAYRMLKKVDNYQVEVLITLALVTGGYALASRLHVSGPIAVVIAGLLIGNRGRLFAMSRITREHLDTFWELIDEILNAVLFVLIGLEILLIDFSPRHALVGALAIVIVLAARLIAVGVPIFLLKRFRRFSRNAVKILTWGGLRGGISVALALSLPAGPARDLFLPVTYSVVLFSIIVQGLTIGKLIDRTEFE